MVESAWLGPNMLRCLGGRHVLDVALRVARALKEVNARYFVGGSLASSIDGEPRATNNIDFVIDIPTGKLRKFVESLGSDFEFDYDMLKDAVLHGRSANAFYLPLVRIVSHWARARQLAASATDAVHVHVHVYFHSTHPSVGSPGRAQNGATRERHTSTALAGARTRAATRARADAARGATRGAPRANSRFADSPGPRGPDFGQSRRVITSAQPRR